MVRCWSMTEEDSMRGVLVRAKRKESKKERRRKEKRKKFSFFFFFLFSFFWKDQNERPPLWFLQEEKRKKESSHSSKPKKEERKENHNKIYSSRASRNVEAASSAEKKTPTRRIHKARSSSVLMIGFYIARLRDFYCADRTRIFSLFVVFEGREENLSSRSFSCLKTTQQKREEKRRNENEKKLIKKNIIKNVAARALRKTSVLSFRVHHARDIFVMNRWRSSVFFIWTRMYLYITVYPPLLFCLCFFSSSSSSCFFGTLAKGFCLFDQKKRKKEKLFFAFLVPLFSRPFRRLWKRQKKESSFFSSTIWREQTNERECVAEIEKYDRRKSPKRRRSIEEGTFPFLLCRFVFLFLIRMLFRFERRERKGNHQKSPKKERKNSLVGPKNSGSSSSSSSFFCSKNASRQRTKGVTK